MNTENKRTTIYIQAVITTDAVPDLSFFKRLAGTTNVKVEDNVSQEDNVEQGGNESQLFKEVARNLSSAPQKRYDRRIGNPSKTISGKQIEFINTLASRGKFNIPYILETYNVGSLSELTDAQAQQIFEKYK